MQYFIINRMVVFCRILNLFALLGAVGGFGAVYLNKEIAGKKHITTWHGLVGLVAMLGLVGSAVWGIAAKYSTKLRKQA